LHGQLKQFAKQLDQAQLLVPCYRSRALNNRIKSTNHVCK